MHGLASREIVWSAGTLILHSWLVNSNPLLNHLRSHTSLQPHYSKTTLLNNHTLSQRLLSLQGNWPTVSVLKPYRWALNTILSLCVCVHASSTAELYLILKLLPNTCITYTIIQSSVSQIIHADVWYGWIFSVCSSVTVQNGTQTGTTTAEQSHCLFVFKLSILHHVWHAWTAKSRQSG